MRAIVHSAGNVVEPTTCSITDLQHCFAGQRAPQSLFLGVANSGRSRHGQVEQRHSCEVTVYSYYWVANSSRSPLFFWDRPLDSPAEFLDYSSMVAPGSVYGMHHLWLLISLVFVQLLATSGVKKATRPLATACHAVESNSKGHNLSSVAKQPCLISSI